MTSLTFVGTGNFYAPGRYWNGFLIDGRVLVEMPPSVVPNLRRVGVALDSIEVVFLSHFHADHAFGWPFLFHSMLTRERRKADLWVVGPPGIEAFLEELVRAGRLHDHVASARAALGGFDLHCVEVDERPQRAGPVAFRAVRVEHDPALNCYGYLIEREGRTIGYSGDTRLCDGLRQIAAGCDVLVMECSARHAGPQPPPEQGGPPGHSSLDDVRTLRREHPDLPVLLTHLNDDVDADGIPGVRIPDDLETVTV